MSSALSAIVLIACGGNSERMGTDKSQLNYHGKAQFLYLEELVKPFFPEIYFSINKKQSQHFSSYNNVITDSEKYAGHGPVSGLLSCYEEHRNSSIIYLGCDYPLLETEDILKLSSVTDTACAYFHIKFEPLLAHYSTHSLFRLEKEFEAGNFSLQSFLAKENAVKLLPSHPERIKSCDTPEDFKFITEKIKYSPGRKADR